MITEIIVGGLISHFASPAPGIDQFSLQPNMIVKMGSVNVLAGNNSISEPIYGAAYDFNINTYTDFKIGGYIHDATKFNNYQVSLPFGDFMPVIGVEFNLPITDKIGFSQTVTPLFGFSGISYNF
jgi:hypothetical protein